MADLYKHENINFIANGDMTLMPSSCKGKIELNGVCEITLEHPFDKEGRWEYIINDNVIACPTPWSDKQLFRIYHVVKDMTGITAYARHIFFDLIDYNLLDVRPTGKTGQQALDIILANTPFTGHSNISTLSTAYYVRKNIVEALASDDENSFINRWGGERYYDNYNLTINSRVGGDYGVRAEFGYNLTEIEEDINLDEVVTRIIPVGANELMLEGSTPWVDSPNINKYANIKTKPLKFDDVKVKESAEDTEGFTTIEEARAELINRCNKLFTNGLDKPVVNYKVAMAYLKNTTAYKDKGYDVLEDVGIGDTVHCNHSKLNIEVEARCISYEWEVDFIKDKAIITSLELGNAKADYFDKQSDISNRVEKILNNNGTVNGLSIEGVIDALQTKFKAMKDIAQKQHIRAMLFEDLDNTSPTFGAMCIGTMGFEIASVRTADNKDWDWRTFGTGKGFVADCITVGILSTILIQNADGSFKIDLSGTGGASFYNNGLKAMEMSHNALKLFNWGKNGDYIGSLGALILGDDPNKPLIGLWNDIDSAVAIGYQSEDPHVVPAYVYFDKYNIIGTGKPVRFKEEVEFNNTYSDSYRGKDGNVNLQGSILWFAPEGGGASGFRVDSNGNANFGGKITCDALDVMSADKHRVIETSQGKVGINSLETPEVMNEDRYKGRLDENGECVIKIKEDFKECIETDDYDVFPTKYGKGEIWVQERNLDSFLVCGTPNLEFACRLIAIQKGCKGIRLKKI